jgi:hypothetical protein
MSWTDKKSIEQFKKLRDYYRIKTFIETGTFKGVNAAVHANNFNTVITCELTEEYYWQAKKKLFPYTNVHIVLNSSPVFLNKIKPFLMGVETIFIYLDAHFYNPNLPPEERWVVIKELQALEGLDNCVIVIHDFDCNGLGHLVYDGQDLNLKLLLPYLSNINKDFHYYGNTKETCDIMTKERVSRGEIPNLTLDDVTINNLDYAWTHESKTYRGILYCTPTKLDLNNFELTELKV